MKGSKGVGKQPTTLEEQEAIYKRRVERYKEMKGLTRAEIIRRVNEIVPRTRGKRGSPILTTT